MYKCSAQVFRMCFKNTRITTVLHVLFNVLIIVNYVISYVPLVTIKNGTLEGTIMKTRKGRDLLGFRGIPYATPPLGSLRFEVNY